MGEADRTADETLDGVPAWPHGSHAERLAPLPRGERAPEAEELLAGLRAGFGDPDGPDMNLFATLAHHPRLLGRWSRFGGTLLFAGELPARDREVLILRTAWNCRAEYEWSHHIPIGHRAGLSDADIARIAQGADAEGLPDDDAVLLRAADDLHRDNRIADDTWSSLAGRYTPAQLVELCMLVGQYHLVAFTLNSLGIQLEEPATG